MDIAKISRKYRDLIANATTIDELQEAANQAFSRKHGEINGLLRQLKDLPDAQKKELGPQLSQLKNEVEQLISQKQAELGGGTQIEFFDHTVPAQKVKRGHMHPLTAITNEIEDFFQSMGFMILDGPEVDSTEFNFDFVNVPKDHPARDMQDTFYVENEDTVLRTHTSNCQVRAMREYGAPLRAIIPGRVFRNEDRDARHEHTFSQFEGLMIDEGISIANFREIMDQFFKKFIGAKSEVRMRPGYFPFVEPGFELDFKCICDGGCGLCKGTGWVEFGGAGMIHPNVLKAGKIDPEKYSGWAFGCSPERLFCIRHGVPDLRMFREGDLRFLEQF